jgi:hypothetical protein
MEPMTSSHHRQFRPDETSGVASTVPAVSFAPVRVALLLVVLAVVAMLVASRIRAAARDALSHSPLEVNHAGREVTFTATIQPFAPALHHLVAAKDSAPAGSALFLSDPSDDSVLGAFATLEPREGTPDGAPVDLLVQWPGSGGRHSLRDIIAQAHPEAPRLDFRLPGIATRHRSDAGCIVLIGSSGDPAVTEGAAGQSIADTLPRPGTAVVLTLRSRMEEA